MRRTAAISALAITALFISGCTSGTGSKLLGLASSGGSASADASAAAIASPLGPVPHSQRSAFSLLSLDGNSGGAIDIGANNGAGSGLDSVLYFDSIKNSGNGQDTDAGNGPSNNLNDEPFARKPAAAQKHRNPRAQPPPHDFLIKPLAKGRLTSGLGYRTNPVTSVVKKHNGIDYAAPRGTEVYAAGAGIVERMYSSRSYGNYIRIVHADGYATAYAHLHSFAKGIKMGSIVMQGDIIGTVGSTGQSTGPHLHFELIHNGRFVDPLSNQRRTTLAASEAIPEVKLPADSLETTQN